MIIDKKFFFRDGIWRKDMKARKYVLNAIQNADKESEFGIKNLELITLPVQDLIKYFPQINKKGYDLMLGYLNSDLIGHIAFQEYSLNKKFNWQAFQIYVDPAFRGRGIGSELQEGLIQKAKQEKIYKIKLGKGINSATIAINKAMLDRGYDVDLETQWIYTKN